MGAKIHEGTNQSHMVLRHKQQSSEVNKTCTSRPRNLGTKARCSPLLGQETEAQVNPMVSSKQNRNSHSRVHSTAAHGLSHH